MGWKLAASLKQLRKELEAAYPDRLTGRDGSIGDAAHSSRESDHNPNDAGYVTAIDVDEDADEAVGRLLWDHLLNKRDRRIKYMIYEGRMVSSYPTSRSDAWEVRPYHGRNMHKGHIHISVVGDKKQYNSRKSWGLAKTADAVPTKTAKTSSSSKEFDVASLQTLKKGDRNENVVVLQHTLGLYSSPTKPDGIFGPDTDRQLRNCQSKLGVVGDGICGPKTWAALLKA